MLAFALIASLFAPAAIAAAVGSTVLTPVGYLPAANVKAVPLGGGAVHVGADIHIVDAEGTVVDKVTPQNVTVSQRAKRYATGWIAYAYWYNTNSSPINDFVTTWPVPSTPSVWSDQTLFYFNSIEPASGTAILQPVLQYGPSAAGGGEYWAVASWYVYGNSALYTSPVSVSVGESLTGVIALTGSSGSNYNYQTYFSGISGTTLTVSNIAQLVWATETLEAYDIASISNYPSGSTVFSGASITLSSGTPSVTWSTANDTSDGIKIAVNTQGATNAKFTVTY